MLDTTILADCSPASDTSFLHTPLSPKPVLPDTLGKDFVKIKA